MEFKLAYTTAEKVSADKEGIEIKKTILSNDAFALGELMELILNKLEHLRLSSIK